MKTFPSVVLSCVLCVAFCAIVQETASGDEIAELKSEVAKLRETIESLKVELANVKSERDALQLRVNRIEKDTAEAERDLFQVGIRWEGTRFISGARPAAKKKAPSNSGQKWSLVVTERNGERFKGRIQFVSPDEQSQQLEVSGSAPTKANGRIVFKTVAIGVLQQSFEGVLKGNQVSLTWEGTNVAGKRLGGTANLSR
jgi:hypothetical protein